MDKKEKKKKWESKRKLEAHGCGFSVYESSGANSSGVARDQHPVSPMLEERGECIVHYLSTGAGWTISSSTRSAGSYGIKSGGRSRCNRPFPCYRQDLAA